MSGQTRHLIDLLSDGLSIDGERHVAVTGITADSRLVKPGFLFAALPGTHVDGLSFVDKAIKAGAGSLLVPQGSSVSVDIPVVYAEDVRRCFAHVAARFYAPQPETVVAVTGTSGKTSVASFVRQIWKSTGLRAASVGTLGVVSPDDAVYGGLTTPGPVSLHQTFQSLAHEGCTHIALEASSHGIDQRRLDGVRLNAAGFTNLGRDHLDYHETTEAYFKAKMRLFDTLLPDDAPAVINTDDEYGRRLAERLRADGRSVIALGTGGGDLSVETIDFGGFGQTVSATLFGKPCSFTLPLVGSFQVSNALLALGLAVAGGLDVDAGLQALETLEGAPGRLECVGRGPEGSLCFVDYAHKPDALEHVLLALRPFTTGRLIVVFGAGGDRDQGKRPVMGEIAARLADRVIVTDDNPRSEDPALIRNAILAAVPGALELGDRREAIDYGVGLLKKGDVLVVAGKGHETGQIIGDRVFPFSDHEALEQALAERGNA